MQTSDVFYKDLTGSLRLGIDRQFSNVTGPNPALTQGAVNAANSNHKTNVGDVFIAALDTAKDLFGKNPQEDATISAGPLPEDNSKAMSMGAWLGIGLGVALLVGVVIYLKK